jgi:hypothetical protein
MFLKSEKLDISQNVSINWEFLIMQSSSFTTSSTGSTHEDPQLSKESLLLTPTDSSQQSNEMINRTTSINLNLINSIMYEERPQITTCRKVYDFAFKTFLAIICYSAGYPTLEPARRNFNNRLLGETFAYAETALWGTLSTWCAFNLYNHATEGRHYSSIKKNLNCASIAYWVSVIGLGLLTEIPTAYTSWYYNENTLFWSFFTPLVFGTFSMLSIDEMLQKIANSNNVISRMFYRNKINNILIRKNLYKLINSGCESLSINTNYALRKKITRLERGESDNNLRIKKMTLIILNEGLSLYKQKLINKEKRWKISEKAIKYISSIIPLSSPVLDGLLIYKAYQLILSSNFIIK